MEFALLKALFFPFCRSVRVWGVRIRSVERVKRCTGRTEWFVLFRVFALTWFTSSRCHFPRVHSPSSSRQLFSSQSKKDFHRKIKLTLYSVFSVTSLSSVLFFFFACLAGNWLHFMSTAKMSCSESITFWPWMLLILCSIQLWGMTCKSAR